MRNLIRLLTLLPLVWALSVQPALGAWPSDWLFLRAEEGWFFYKEPPPPPRLQILPEGPLLPEEPAQQAPLAEEERTDAVPGWTSKHDEAARDELRVVPAGGPQLEAWLLAKTDQDLERLVSIAPAGALRAWIPVLLDQALTVLDRTAVRKYLLAHRESLRRSERFSKLWQEVVWTDPSFDRPDHLPTGSLAQAIYQQETSSKRAATLAALRGSVSLLVVVEPECAACEAQWKILQSWSAESGFTVRPIAKELFTLGDSTLALPYPGVIDQLAVTQFPSLYLVEPTAGYLTRLGSGFLSEDEIVTRMLQLIPTDNLQQKGDLQHVKLSPPPTPHDAARPREE